LVPSKITAAFLISEFDFESLGELSQKTRSSEIKYDKYIEKGEKFSVRCTKIHSDFSSHQIETTIGGNIPFHVDLSNPDIIICPYIVGKTCYLGIDIVGVDLSKRKYKIFSHPDSIKGTLAFFLLKRAGFRPNKKILDPMAGSGTILIESALYSSKMSINYYNKLDLKFTKMKMFEKIVDKFFKKEDKLIEEPPKKEKIFAYDIQLPSINAIKKNAKIAGINKFISLGKSEVDWFDTKFENNTVDLIVTQPPMFSKFNQRQITKLYEQLFIFT
jgi:putative N6-adenine-specific DNA methylase